MVPSDDTSRVTMQRSSYSLPDGSVLPLEFDVQVRAAQPSLQMTAAAVTESVVGRMKAVAETD
jgi:hypothetical protein